MSITRGVKETPMLRQYSKWKKAYSDCLLFFRMGDFYELFFDDAEKAAPILDIALTSRDPNREIPMAGVPWHSAENYIARLVQAGHKVAICEQVTEPDGRNLVDREVIRVITPGTFVPSDSPQEGRLAAAAFSGDVASIALLRTGTGRIEAGSMPREQALAEIAAFKPLELLIPRNMSHQERELLKQVCDASLVEADPDAFVASEASRRLCGAWKVATLEGFGFDEGAPECGSAWVVYDYLSQTQFGAVGHVRRIFPLRSGRHLYMDRATQLNLEITESDNMALCDVLDECRTAMGKRLLRQWLLHPLLDTEEISERHLAVEVLAERPDVLRALRRALSFCGDVERAVARMGMRLAAPRDLGVIRDTLAAVPGVREALEETPLPEPYKEVKDPQALRTELQEGLADELPRTLREGRVIRQGYDGKLDELRNWRSRSEELLQEMIDRERAETGIRNLKVGYNKVFGYYLEVSRSNLEQVPERYHRKQTLVGAERYITGELKEFEEKMLSNDEEIKSREEELYLSLCQKVTEETARIQDMGASLAALDVLASFAAVALQRGYRRPGVDRSFALDLKDARHPVVEVMLDDSPYTPNDILLDSEGARMAVVTGPNMAGKSTYLRSAALLVVMAQAGSFVPASEARLGTVDRIFSRIGARDELSKGKSTFMVEMVETANILHNVTPRSLVILDEIGRGTSTYDGVSIAWAVMEYLHTAADGMTKVLFATHYHELSALADRMTGVFNLSFAVEETDKGVLFLYRLQEAPADRSYGIEVARLAGVPEAVVSRSQKLLRRFEEEGAITGNRDGDILGGGAGKDNKKDGQLQLFRPGGEDILRELASADPDSMTPLGALEFLYALRRRAKEALKE
ncbi:MAG: DNA mismatch repair protein MutS [Thermovirgaceae bacterium]